MISFGQQSFRWLGPKIGGLVMVVQSLENLEKAGNKIFVREKLENLVK